MKQLRKKETKRTSSKYYFSVNSKGSFVPFHVEITVEVQIIQFG